MHWSERLESTNEAPANLTPVQSDTGEHGLLYRHHCGEKSAFDQLYARLDGAESVPILSRSTGEVVFRDQGGVPTNLPRFSLRAINTLDGLNLSHLDVDCIRATDEDRLIIFPTQPEHAQTPPLVALGHYLRRLSPLGQSISIDQIVTTLTDPSPEVRRTARTLLAGTEDSPKTGTLKLTVTTKRTKSAVIDVAEPRAAVVIPVHQLCELSREQKSAAAGLAQLSLQAIDGFIAADLPLVLGTYRRSAEAKSAAASLSLSSGLPISTLEQPSVFRILLTALFGSFTASAALASIVFFSLGLLTLPLLLCAVTIVFGVLTGWNATQWIGARKALTSAIHASKEASEERHRRSSQPELRDAWAALSEARRSLSEAQLAPSPSHDVRSILTSAERELDELSAIQRTISRGLSTTSSHELQRRINLIDTDDPTSQTRLLSLTKTLAEISKLEHQQQQIIRRADSLEAVLTQITVALSSCQADDPNSMERLAVATSAARQMDRQ